MLVTEAIAYFFITDTPLHPAERGRSAVTGKFRYKISIYLTIPKTENQEFRGRLFSPGGIFFRFSRRRGPAGRRRRKAPVCKEADGRLRHADQRAGAAGDPVSAGHFFF
jgi:hypothetical protein